MCGSSLASSPLILVVHHRVYEAAHILHRNLSPNGIMWYRIGDKVHGVLCDHELVKVRTGGATFSTPAQAPMGPRTADMLGLTWLTDWTTQPAEVMSSQFVVMDLLREGPPPPHLYRHALESLFYILVYVCASLDLQKKFQRLLLWERELPLEVGMNKKMFFIGGIEGYAAFFVNCNSEVEAPIDRRGEDNRVYH